jgi:hypothetical protein
MSIEVNENKTILIRTVNIHIKGIDCPEKPNPNNENAKKKALKQIVIKIPKFINKDTIKILSTLILKNFKILIINRVVAIK